MQPSFRVPNQTNLHAKQMFSETLRRTAKALLKRKIQLKNLITIKCAISNQISISSFGVRKCTGKVPQMII